jgi:ribA/ribD-fused uncharacterized protein
MIAASAARDQGYGCAPMNPLITDVATLRAAVERGETFSYRFFWRPLVAADGRLTDACLGQWWMSDFVVDGVTYTSAEQWMMAGKATLFGDRAMREEILATRDPAVVKKLGKKVRNFDEATWKARCLDLVTDGNVAKFSQDAALRAHLVGTGDAVLVEASPLDKIWGIGLAADHPDACDPRRWRGANLLGFALMRARARITTD